tara:strand:+ start:8886 stop:9359 length:474 start_codon:yes stop_codon:yes gene_type:complete
MDEIIVFLASKLHVVIVVTAIVIFLLSSRQKRVTLALTAITALPLSYLLGKLANFFYYTERPFSELGIAPLVPHIADNGFPSEHTLYAMVIAITVFFVNKKWGLLLMILAILVGVGRVLAYVHNPIDIIGAVLVASVAVWGTVFVLQRINIQYKIKP